MHGFLP
jgi:hypothetical protein